MTRKAIALCFLVLALAVAGCSDNDRSEGSVILSVTDFDALPVQISASDVPPTIDGLLLRNIPKNAGAESSELQSIELRSYEIRYTRRDTGTRVPPPLVQNIFGVVPVNGDLVIDNLPILLTNQLRNPPLVDLADRGADTETGTAVIVLTASMRFFGRTLAGENVASQPAVFTIEVFP